MIEKNHSIKEFFSILYQPINSEVSQLLMVNNKKTIFQEKVIKKRNEKTFVDDCLEAFPENRRVSIYFILLVFNEDIQLTRVKNVSFNSQSYFQRIKILLVDS